MATNEIENGCGKSTEAVLESKQKRRCVFVVWRVNLPTAGSTKAVGPSPLGILRLLPLAGARLVGEGRQKWFGIVGHQYRRSLGREGRGIMYSFSWFRPWPFLTTKYSVSFKSS